MFLGSAFGLVRVLPAELVSSLALQWSLSFNREKHFHLINNNICEPDLCPSRYRCTAAVVISHSVLPPPTFSSDSHLLRIQITHSPSLAENSLGNRLGSGRLFAG